MQRNLRDFIAEQLNNTDIFCFQEASGEPMEMLCKMLQDNGFTKLWAEKDLHDWEFSLAMFASKSVRVEYSRTILGEVRGSGFAQYARLTKNKKTVCVCSVHGVPQPGDKLDTPARIGQSREIIDTLAAEQSVIVCGDFNLLPDTESVKVFRQSGYKDLIHDYQIETTRNQLAWQRFPDSKQLFADFVFTRGVVVKNFVVPQNEASDHLPLVLNFDSIA